MSEGGFVFLVTMVNYRTNQIYELFVVAQGPSHAIDIVQKSNRSASDRVDDWQPRDARPLQTNVRHLDLTYAHNFDRGVETVTLEKP